MNEIVSILSAIQQALKAPKGQTNKFGGFNYRSCEDILEALKPITTKLGAAVVISDDIVEVSGRHYVKATATLLYNAENISVSAFAREPESKKGNDEAQITGSSSSYARKYALNGLFAIDDTKDADTQDNREKPAQRRAESPQRPTEPAADIPAEVAAALAYVVPFGAHKGETIKTIYKTDRDAIVDIRHDAAAKDDADTLNALNVVAAFIKK